MKKVMVIALMAIFSTALFAQTKPETATGTHKKKVHSTEATAPAKHTKQAVQPASTQPAVKKSETATPAKK